MSNPPSLQRGQLVGNDYLLQKSLSEGPLGAVWRVLDQRRGVMACVRFLPEAFRSRPEAMQRFKQHFPGVQSFRHPHVVTPDRFVEDPVIGPFWVSRCVEGLQLDDYALQWSQAEGKFPFPLVFDVLRPVAAALDEAHANYAMQHRSLTPRSIVVSSTEGVQVLGLELVGLVREELSPKYWQDDTERCRYLAPEQWEGKPSALASDQYALAAIAYELLGGKIVAPGTVMPPIPGQSDDVNMSLQRAMQRDPGARFPSCQLFLDALSGVLPAASPLPPSVDPPVILTAPQGSGISVAPSSAPPVFAGAPGSTLSSAQPIPPTLEAISSFEKIASSATKAKASTIEKKIKQDRRFQQFFRLWNVAVLLVVCAVAFAFRDRLSTAWEQHFGKPAVPTANGSDDPEGFGSKIDDGERKANGNVESAKPAPKKTATPTSAQTPRTRSTSKSKEPEFGETQDAAFKGAVIDDEPDKVRFVGTSGVGKRIVFVVDVSAAMGSGVQQTPLAHAVKEIGMSFGDLNASQQFQVVYFNDEAKTLPQDANDLISANKSNCEQARSFLKTLKGAGQGDPINALLKALALKPDLVFFLTDQQAVQMDPAQIELVKKQAGTIPINTVEIGTGMEPDAATVVKKLSQACNGRFQWVNATMHNLARSPGK